MGDTDNRIKLYTSQADAVLQAIERDGCCFSRESYVSRKYGESAPIFLTAYRWFVKEAERLVPKPEGAEFPYWAFQDLYSVEQSGNTHVLTLMVPIDEVVLFDMYDWNQILCMKLLGENKDEEREFHAFLEACGVKESTVMLTGFYPEWRQRIMDSWSRLFCHHEAIKAGKGALEGVRSVQAGLWRIKKEWIVRE